MSENDGWTSRTGRPLFLLNRGLQRLFRSFMELLAPNILAWLERVDGLEGVPEGATFAPWEQVADTLGALLRDQVGGLFLPWSVANVRAVATATAGSYGATGRRARRPPRGRRR